MRKYRFRYISQKIIIRSYITLEEIKKDSSKNIIVINDIDKITK